MFLLRLLLYDGLPDIVNLLEGIHESLSVLIQVHLSCVFRVGYFKVCLLHFKLEIPHAEVTLVLPERALKLFFKGKFRIPKWRYCHFNVRFSGQFGDIYFKKGFHKNPTQHLLKHVALGHSLCVFFWLLLKSSTPSSIHSRVPFSASTSCFRSVSHIDSAEEFLRMQVFGGEPLRGSNAHRLFFSVGVL